MSKIENLDQNYSLKKIDRETINIKVYNNDILVSVVLDSDISESTFKSIDMVTYVPQSALESGKHRLELELFNQDGIYFKKEFHYWDAIASMVDQSIDIALNLSQSGHPGGSRSKMPILIAALEPTLIVSTGLF